MKKNWNFYFCQNNRNVGTRELVDKFQVGKIQIANMSNKDEIYKLWITNENDKGKLLNKFKKSNGIMIDNEFTVNVLPSILLNH